MVSLNIKGTLGKYGWKNVPDEIIDDILPIAGLTAYKTAYQKAPYLAKHAIHLREAIEHFYDKVKRIYFIIVHSPYGFVTEFGGRRHYLPHPFIRPASKAAQNKIRAIIRLAAKQAIIRQAT